MTLSPKLGVVGISTLWHFRLPLPIQMFIKVASSPRLSGIGMPSPILWSHPLKMQRIVLLSSLLWWELGTNSLITGPGEWLSFRRFTSNYPDPDPCFHQNGWTPHGVRNFNPFLSIYCPLVWVGNWKNPQAVLYLVQIVILGQVWSWDVLLHFYTRFAALFIVTNSSEPLKKWRVTRKSPYIIPLPNLYHKTLIFTSAGICQNIKSMIYFRKHTYV